MINFHFEAEADVTQVFLVGSFNAWNPASDEMVLRRTENKRNVFELYLELYSGLYYYKFYIPTQKRYVCDPTNTNKVNDSFGGFNSVLEIPIQTRIKHPYLQSAQLKADTWWKVDSDTSHGFRSVSYDNLGILATAPQHAGKDGTSKRVKEQKRTQVQITSWARETSPMHSVSGSTNTFSISYTELDKVHFILTPSLQLDRLEGDVRASLGPQYGFDLRRIGDHYKFFRGLRKEYSVLHDGQFFPLHVRPITAKVAAFCRFLQSEIFIVVASFESEPTTVSLELNELALPLHWMGEHLREDKGLWAVHFVQKDTHVLVRWSESYQD